MTSHISDTGETGTTGTTGESDGTGPSGAGRNPVIVVGAAIVHTDTDTVLCARRSAPPRLAGQWEFPGGKVEAGETDSDAVVRECREELGVEVSVGPRIGADARIDDRLTLRVYLARLRPDQPEPRPLEDHDLLSWVPRHELLGLDWLAPDIPIVEELAQTAW
jgi:8-oxo-dGTP diphosphatase